MSAFLLPFPLRRRFPHFCVTARRALSSCMKGSYQPPPLPWGEVLPGGAPSPSLSPRVALSNLCTVLPGSCANPCATLSPARTGEGCLAVMLAHGDRD